ncbi:FtsW/RodA/SpoVE family cell cycle protein [Vagococcus intermedius]|uniref:Probable peptidoglycan glycosyltransferase FtsW n=1 Tax=Vagococcus intermedius TaxID=2991418 RepID=A0AAF0I5C6_9ENTE|nr:FtsW/RodA/SpoVE family cell cycle protein [Vagococcus intermedius]WEG72898.1 FtsW/RodA/SpoVE family cell cycle protein [Vagococcus intermedius]WEG74985.1 FtsW/RodA/SpoVE family cell cycle protein [Vagococcus intermedius]
MGKKAKKIIYLDYGILIPYLILAVLGIIMAYSASSYRLMNSIPPRAPWSDALKESVFLVISFVLIIVLYKMKTELFQNKRLIMTGIGIISIMLFLTRFTPLGAEVNGARGWLKFGPLGNIQPAEFLKIMIVWYLAYIFARRQDIIKDNFKKAALGPLFLVGFLICLVLIQPDTGGAVILFLIAAVLILASGLRFLYSVLFIGGLGVFGYIGVWVVSKIPQSMYPSSFTHVYGRFASYKDPFLDPYDLGHQMVNSYYAIYRGGWFGKGLGNSVQKKGFLPEAHSDFMFSIILEELGLIVGIGLLLLLLFLILRIIWIGIQATTAFNSLMCIGIGGMMLIQTFVNVGGITGLIPLTGVTFPFLSQGGSSLLTLSIGIGFVLNIRANELRRHYEGDLQPKAEIIPMVDRQQVEN